MGGLIDFFHARGVRTVFNLHPHFGIQFYDAIYGQFAAALGRDAEAAQGKPMLGDYTNRSWVEPFFRMVSVGVCARVGVRGVDVREAYRMQLGAPLHSFNCEFSSLVPVQVMSGLDDLGVDAWWLDWQQGEWTPIHGLSPTVWISYCEE